jgi:hypothetical protein
MDGNDRRALALQLAYQHHEDSRRGPASADDIVKTAARFEQFLEGPQTGCDKSQGIVLGDEIPADHPYNPPAVSVTVRPADGHPKRLSAVVYDEEGWSSQFYPNASSVIHMLDSLRCRYPADIQVSVFAQSEAAEEVLRWCRDILPVDRVFAP